MSNRRALRKEKPVLVSKTLGLQEVEEILLYFSSSIYGCNTVDEILWDLVKNCIGKLGFVDCVVYMIDENNLKLIQKAAYGPKNPKNYLIYNPIAIPVGEGIVGSVANTGVAEIINNTSGDIRYLVDDEKRLSEITVPIIYRGKVLGVIDSEHPDKNFFTLQHFCILKTIAAICANKIARSIAEDEYQKKQNEVIAINKKLADLKLEALRSQMNPHFIFNSLNAVQYFIVTNQKKSSLRYLSKFSKIIRYILDNIYTESLTLEEELQMLDLYLELESIRFGDKFTYEIKRCVASNKSFIKIPFLLIQPFVEEAIEKRILGSGRMGQISVSFALRGDFLQCSIKDNGISKKDSDKLQLSKNLNLEPNGVEIALQRIKYINEQRSNKIDIQVHNLSTDNPLGTEVILSIPLDYES